MSQQPISEQDIARMASFVQIKESVRYVLFSYYTHTLSGERERDGEIDHVL